MHCRRRTRLHFFCSNPSLSLRRSSVNKITMSMTWFVWSTSLELEFVFFFSSSFLMYIYSNISGKLNEFLNKIALIALQRSVIRRQWIVSTFKNRPILYFSLKHTAEFFLRGLLTVTKFKNIQTKKHWIILEESRLYRKIMLGNFQFLCGQLMRKPWPCLFGINWDDEVDWPYSTIKLKLSISFVRIFTNGCFERYFFAGARPKDLAQD